MSVSNVKKNWVEGLLKSAIAVLVLVWLFNSGKFDFSILFDSNTGKLIVSIWYFSIMLVPLSIYLLAHRWMLFLKLYGIEISLWTSFKLTSISNFFMTVLPGVIGADVVKTFYLCKNMDLINHRLDAVSATLIDRIIGTYALFLIGTVTSIFFWCSPEYLSIDPEKFLILKKLLLVTPTLFLITTIILIISTNSFCYNLLLTKPLFSRIPFFNNLCRIIGNIYFIKKNIKLTLWLITISVINHLTSIFLMICVMHALHVNINNLLSLLINSIGLVANLIPITPGGIGITEGAFQHLYTLIGSNYGATIGLISRLLNYVVFVLLGLPLYLFNKSNQTPKCAYNCQTSDTVLTKENYDEYSG